ncbi:MAG: cation:proton antiporter [Candidatus Tectimicrobiota bacterium]
MRQRARGIAMGAQWIPERQRAALLIALLGVGGVLWLAPTSAWAAGAEGQHATLISSIGLSILAATVLAFLSHAAGQPLLLAYIAAGVLIGPQIGFGLVTSETDIRTISEIGLIILLFMIGLEINISKLRQAGVSLLLSGVGQFILCSVLGVGFFYWLGYGLGQGTYDVWYLACCCALSSTTIVVKLLYSKFELDTLAGRLTLGILVFQDIWAIVILGIQPNLANPDLLGILGSFAKGGLLLLVSLLVSRYVLPALFHTVAKIPEIILVASLGWCFAVAGLAGALGLSIEMGALIAGVAISTFPYNMDVIAKIISIRDFFITLFFVTLGMEIPNPWHNLPLLGIAVLASIFLIASRFLTIYPLLYVLKNGTRVSLLTSINLSQMSEFSLVIGAIGLAQGHIGREILSSLVFVFVLTSILSTYMIQYSDRLQKTLNRALQRLGIKDLPGVSEDEEPEESQDIVLLGFYRVASSFLHEILDREAEAEADSRCSKASIVVVDFNPEVHRKLRAYGVKGVYGDISHLDTLHHVGIHEAKVVLSTIPDSLLVGTDNLRLMQHIQSLCPHARILVTAEDPARALELYTAGADYVLMPRLIAAQHVYEMTERLLQGSVTDIADIKQAHIEQLQLREEIVR